MEHLGDHYHSKTFCGEAKSWYQRAMGAGNQSVRNSAGGKIARLFNDCDSHSLDILNWCLKAGRPGAWFRSLLQWMQAGSTRVQR